MKTFLKSLSLLAVACALFNCSNEAPMPVAHQAASESGNPDASLKTSALIDGNTILQPNQMAWRLAKTLSVPMDKGFNISSPYAITEEGQGDISWGISVCYPELRPVKVAFNNLGIVDIATLTPLAVSKLAFNQYIIANAPNGSASWTNYMPAKTIIACKAPGGKYYLLEILVDNPLKMNIYVPVRI